MLNIFIAGELRRQNPIKYSEKILRFVEYSMF